MPSLWKLLSGPVASAALASLCGCGGAGETYVPTRGQVLNGAKPAEGALVTLVPVDGKDRPISRPAGVVRADGSYSISTYEPATRTTHEGAPPGRYAVLVTWYPQATLGGIDPSAPQVDRLGGRYKDPNASPFHAEVQGATTELAPIVVTESKGKAASPFGG